MDRNETISFSRHVDTATVNMGGTMDGFNTFTYPNVRTFENMDHITISNKGTVTIHRPRMLVNGRRPWYDIHALRKESSAGAVTNKDKALSLWEFMRNNRLHYWEPDQGKESDDPVKMLGVYGYGLCYNTGNAAGWLMARYDDFNWSKLPYREFRFGGLHNARDFLFGDDYMLLDPDVEVFYLETDNEHLATHDEVVNDKYLIRRVHHYGKASPPSAYNSRWNANAVYWPESPATWAGAIPDNKFHTLDYELRPGESFTFSWDAAKYYHHNFRNGHNAPLADMANGRLSFNTNFRNAALGELLSSVEGVSVSGGAEPAIRPMFAGQPASFIVKITSPYPIVNGVVIGDFFRNSSSDYIKMFYSPDASSWVKVWEQASVGPKTETITLNGIEPLDAPAIYKYYLKFEILANDPTRACGLDSLSILSDFQMSRSNLPSLQLGDNLITYSDTDAGSVNVEIEVAWKENDDNTLPTAVASPIYPANDSSIDSLRLAFKWQPADDPDGIVDYEFLLSDRPDTRFPLSPTFEVYTSLASTGGLNEFEIPMDGLLNPGTTYYWKVRAKDARGAWGSWSQTWSFVPHGPTPPKFTSVLAKTDSLILSWQADSKGSTPAYFEVHGSNEAFGFSPEPATLLDTTSLAKHSFVLGDTPPLVYYRIIAVDANGARSAPSAALNMPYPYVYHSLDSVYANAAYSIDLSTNMAYTAEMLPLLPFWLDVNVPDEIVVSFVSKPNWLSYDPVKKTLSGTPNYVQSQQDAVTIEMKSVKTGRINRQTLRPPVRASQPPTIQFEDSVAFVGSPFTGTITASDPDIERGDAVTSMEVVSKPAWLEVEISTNEPLISLSGTPGFEHAGDTLLIVRANDLTGFTKQTYTISVLDTIRPVVSSYSNTVAGTGQPFSSTPSVNRPVKKFELIMEKSWLAIDSVTGALHGMPLMTNPRSNDIAVRVTAANGLSSEANFTIDVPLINKLPELADTDTVAYSEGDYAAIIHIRDENLLAGDTVRSEILVKPSWLDVRVAPGDTVISLTGSPGFQHAGDTLLTVRANDLNGFSERSYVISVLDTIRPLILSYSNFDGATGRPFTSAPSVNRPVSKFELLTNISWLAIDSLTGVLQGTPLMTDAGTYVVEVQVHAANGLSSKIEFSVEIELINVLPVVSNIDTAAFVRSDYQSTIHIRDNDVPFGDILRPEILTKPAWLTADILPGDSLISLTGTPGFDDMTDTTLTVRVSDLFGHIDRTYTFAVNDTIRPHVQGYSNSEGGTGLPFTSTPSLNRPVTKFELLTANSWLNIDSVTGVLQGTPLMTDARTYVIDVRVSAVNGLSSVSEFTFDIQLINKLPVLSGIDSVTYVTNDYASTIHIRDDDVVFGDIISSEILTKPAWLTAEILPGDSLISLTGTPGFDDVTDTILTVRAHDLFSQSERTYAFVMRDTIRPVLHSYSSYTGGTGRPFTAEPATNRPVGKFELLTTNTWLQVDATTGTLQGTPLMTDDGGNTFTVRLTAVNGLSSDAEFTVDVEVINEVPVLSEIEPVAYAGSEYVSTVHVRDKDIPVGDVIRSEVVSKPAWLTAHILPGDTLISIAGTPSIDDLLDRTLTIRSSDLFGRSERTYVLVMRDTIRPRVLGLSNSNATWGKPFASTVLTSRPVEFELAKTSWVDLDPLSGELTGLAPVPIGDANIVHVKVRAPNGLESEVALRINIEALNSPPELSSIGTTAYMGSKYFANILIHDDDFSRKDSIQAVAVIEKPGWLSVAHAAGDRKIEITGLPRLTDVGASKLTLQVFDYLGSVSVTYTMVVLDTLKQLPLLVSNQIAVENATFEAKVTSANTVESIELIDPPLWISLDTTKNVLKGKPRPEDVGVTTVVARVIQPGGKEYTDRIDIAVFTVGKASVSGEEFSCRGDTTTVVFRHEGEKPWNLTYSVGDRIVTVNDIQASTYRVDTLLQLTAVRFALIKATSWPGTALIEGTPSVTANVIVPEIGVLDRYARVGRWFSAQVPIKKGCDVPLAFEIVSGPEWLNVDQSTGEISGMPPASGIGTERIFVGLSDMYGQIQVKQLEFQVTAIPTLGIHDQPVHTLCRGDEVDLSLHFTGIPPWTVTVDDGTNETTVKTSSTPFLLHVVPQANLPVRILRFQDALSDGAIRDENVEFKIADAGSVSVSPNPTSDETIVSIRVCKPGPIVVEVFNSFGQRVARLADEIVDGDRLDIPWTSARIPTGVYLVVLQVTDGNKTFYATERVMHVD